MKIQPVASFTADNFVCRCSSYDDFSIHGDKSSLVLYKDELLLGSFDEIVVYEKHLVFVGRNKDVYTIVNENGDMCSDFSAVDEYLFFDQKHLYIGVKKHVAKGDAFNVLDLSEMSFLYNVEHRASVLSRFKKRVDRMDWPYWIRLQDVDNGIMIIERAVDSFSFNKLPNLSIAPIINYVDNYQRLPNGDYIVHETRFDKFKILEASGKLSSEHCAGFKTSEELASLEKEYIGNDFEKLSPQRDARIQGAKINFPDREQSLPIERPLPIVEPVKVTLDNVSEKASNEEVQNIEQPETFGAYVVECAKRMLEISSRERVETALSVLFFDRVLELRGVDDCVDECLDELIAANDAFPPMDTVFFDSIRCGLATKQLKDDFDVCRSYLSRNISDAKELFDTLCADEMIGGLVKEAADSIISNYRANLKVPEELTQKCFTCLLDSLCKDNDVNKHNMMVEMNKSVKEFIYDSELISKLNSVFPLYRFPLHDVEAFVMDHVCLIFKNVDDIRDALKSGSCICQQTYYFVFSHEFDQIQELLDSDREPFYWLLLQVDKERKNVIFYDRFRPLTYVLETRAVYFKSLKRFK